MGIFGAIGRETKGAVRSLGYDLRRSRRFRRIGVIAVATIAGGVLATGALLREPVPGLAGLGGDGEGADIIEGWFGLGSDTQGQDAESSASASEAPVGGEAADPGSVSSTAVASEGRGSGSGVGDTPGGAPGLIPVGEETPGPSEEEGGTKSPTPSPEPTEEPTTAEPTEEPTEEPTTAEPTEEPSESASPSHGQSPRNAFVPQPRKAPAGN